MFRKSLLAHFDANARVLPWRTTTRDPYAVWVSEIMLQQTRVTTVIPFFERFMERFPTLETLARAALDDVLGAWRGLGYYRRARAMHQAARQVLDQGRTSLPTDRESLARLSGIGQYTSAAIASMAFNEPVAAVDGNVLRVLSRISAEPEPIDLVSVQRKIQCLAAKLLDPNQPGKFNEAMMELGATICTPKLPSCPQCPVKLQCQAFSKNIVAELPVRLQKKTSPWVYTNAFVITSGEKVLLSKRDNRGLFGGLWEPPMVDRTCSAYLQKVTELTGKKGYPLPGTITHVLTHRVFDVHVLRWDISDADIDGWPLAKGYEDIRWISKPALTRLGMSVLADKVMRLAGL